MSPLGIARDCKKDRSIIRDQSCSTTIHLELSPRPQRKGGLLARWFRDDVPQPIGIATAGQAPSVATQSTDRDCKGWSTGTGVPAGPITFFPWSTQSTSCSMHQGGALGPSANSAVSPFITEQERLAGNSDVPQWQQPSSSAEYDGFDYGHLLDSMPPEMSAAGPSYAVLVGAPPGALSVSSQTGLHDAAAAVIPSCSLLSAPTSVVWSGLGPLHQTSDGACVYDGAFMGACVAINTPTAQQQVGSSSIHWQHSLAATISRQVPLQRPQMSTQNSQAQLLQLQQQQQQVETPPLKQPHQQEQQAGYLEQLQQSLQSCSMVQQQQPQQQQACPDEQRQTHHHHHHHHQQQQQHEEACTTRQPPTQDCSASCNHECTLGSSVVGECPPLSGGLPTAGVTAAALAAAGATGTTALVALGAAAVDFATTSALPGASQAGLATLMVAAAAVDGGGGSISTGTGS